LHCHRRCLLPSNENKMSDGHRERALFSFHPS
jgi:hypothetical protein